jgi:hypothetical protein
MGLFSSILGAAAPLVGSYLGGPIGGAIGGALGGALGGSKQSGTTTTTQQQQMDPAYRNLLYGADGKSGILNQITGLANTPRSTGASAFGSNINDYLGNWGGNTFVGNQQAAQALQGSNFDAPGVTNATVGQAWVNAPGQNNIDLTGNYNDFLNSAPGANPYLTGAIGRGINQANNAFGALQRDSTQNLLENVLPSIRSNAIAAGGFGGSRQGIAEGRALDSFAKEQQRALSQVGQNNTDAAVAAQAAAYDADRNRQLSALQGLSGQQYGVAGQNANLWQQTNNANAGYYQDSQRANQQSILDTNRLNSGNRATGIGLSSGLLGQANNYLNQNDNYDLGRLSQIAGAISPFSGLGGSSSTSTPYYTNPGANALGGAAAGLGLYQQFAGGGPKTTGSLYDLFSTPSSGSTIW